MARVTIDSGPVDASDRLREVPQSKWFELMQVRRDFLGVHLPLDCRRLLEFVEDAEQMYAPLNFTSAEDFIQRGLKLDPQQVAWAVDGLRQMQPDKPIPFDQAVKFGKHGGDRRSEKAKANQVGNANLVSSKGTTRAYIIARLERDHPKIAEALAAGEFKSARAAGIAAGIVKPRIRRCPSCGHEW